MSSKKAKKSAPKKLKGAIAAIPEIEDGHYMTPGGSPKSRVAPGDYANFAELNETDQRRKGPDVV